MPTNKLDSFTHAYIDCALWSSNDNTDDSSGQPLDANYSVEDLAPDTLASMIADCQAFQHDNADDLMACTLNSTQQGQDFWLTRNGHGAGFWDRKHISASADAALDRLTDASKVYGSVDLYVGDDGRIYGS